jgi:hypothetical protein
LWIESFQLSGEQTTLSVETMPIEVDSDVALNGIRSIVLHEQIDGLAPKRLCCDMAPPPRQETLLQCEQFAPIAGESGVGFASDGGSAAIVWDEAQQLALVVDSLTPLRDDALALGTFVAHAHVAPCADGGGAHWQIDSNGPVCFCCCIYELDDAYVCHIHT